ncbi:HAMP domain-containing histidine kinase [Candidatus Saccharibacteria bacterium]|nr:HAMP domain-containing histidine kinase [Candidatus Saccharibacteria bacterium]
MSYLLIIMFMSIGFSIIFYNTSIGELQRQMPPERILNRFDEVDPIINKFFEDRLNEGRSHLLLNLVALNCLTLLAGAGISYVLARRTLLPIENAMESQSRFTLDASHELRTPLAAIQVENEVALRSRSLTLARARELLQSNVEEVTKLRGLADGLLRLARDEAPQREPVPIKAAVDEALYRVTAQAAERRVTLKREDAELTVMAELTSLTQVLVTLLDNAIKYSPADTAVTLRAVRQGTLASIEVSDQGPGIEPEEADRIFERFYRADQSRSRQHVEGYGLGLSIARKLVTQLGGSIAVKSRPGKGATFVVKLPIVKNTRRLSGAEPRT